MNVIILIFTQDMQLEHNFPKASSMLKKAKQLISLPPSLFRTQPSHSHQPQPQSKHPLGQQLKASSKQTSRASAPGTGRAQPPAAGGVNEDRQAERKGLEEQESLVETCCLC